MKKRINFDFNTMTPGEYECKGKMSQEQIIEIRDKAYKNRFSKYNKKSTKEEKRNNKNMEKVIEKRDALSNETKEMLLKNSNNIFLIPTDLSNEIIIGMQDNPILKDITIKNVNNLAIPRASLIEKDGKGKIEFAYDMLDFNKIKERLITCIDENIVISNANRVVEFTQDIFKKILNDFTIETIFDKSNKLSIFNNKEVEKGIKGTDHLESINKTLETIPKNFRNKVSIVVNTSTYMEIAILLGKLNLSSLLTDEKSIYGKIRICDYIENGEMILGDLSQLCFNYHWIKQDSDKDIKRGLHIVALATEYDFKILLPKLIRYIAA